MSKEPCAIDRSQRALKPGRPSPSNTFFFLVLVAPFLFFGISWAQQAPDQEQIIVNIILNSENKGEYFVYYTKNRDFLVRAEDLKEAGFTDPRGTVYTIAGEPCISLRSINDVSFTLDEKTLTLNITANPEMLKKKVFDLKPGRATRVYYPSNNSAFFNYGISYFSDVDSSDSWELNMTNELGLRLFDVLFLTDSTYSQTRTDNEFVRLQSNATYDFRKDMRRLVVGDFFALSGDLGGEVNLGGLSYSKVYNIDPYFIKQPLFNFSGQTTLPSEADIYVDGVMIRREKLSPGGFELRNIQYYGGYRNVDIVIRDAFGRERTIQNPFFFNDILLKKGLHEYSYNVGFLRRSYGQVSNDYGDPAFSFFHRYGVSDKLALGFRGEGTGDLMNYGPSITFLEKYIGIFTVSLSQSTGDYEGYAGLFSHIYQSSRISTQFMVQGYTKNYRTLTSKDLTDAMKYQVNAGIGYNSKGFGSLSFNYNNTKKYIGADIETFTATYQRQLTENMQMSLSFNHSNQNDYGNEFSLRLTYYPWKDITMTLAHQKDSESDTTSFQAQKNTPTGEGYGYRLSAQRRDAPGVASTFVNPFFQLNGPHGIYSGEFRGQYDKEGATETYQLSASGGIVYVANTIGFTRPVYDSFGLVKVGELQGVEVLQNNQVTGRTNSSGKVFVPTMNSFTDNFLSINDKNLPMNYSVKDVNRRVSPPFRSGSFIAFDVKKIQGITGTLKAVIDGSAKPVEFQEISIIVNKKKVSFPTGKGGEFYLENIPPGRYRAQCTFLNKTLIFDIIIPVSDDIIIDLGGMTVENPV